jgi:hypothetical protein
MIKRVRLLLVLTGLFLGVGVKWARAEIDLGAVGTYPQLSSLASQTPMFGFPGGGLVLNFRMGNAIAFQLGGLYMTRSYSSGSQVNTTLLDGMAGFKFKLGRFLFINLGGYYNDYLKNPDSWTGSDYGIYAGLGIKIPLGVAVSLLINPMYHYCLSSVTNANGSLTPHEWVAFAGLSFGR